MPSISVPGGSQLVIGNQNDTVTVFGNGTVVAGNGNDGINILGRGIAIVGNGNDTINVGDAGTVIAGGGNDQITVHGNGNIIVGDGADTISLYGSGRITQVGATGHDTINLGFGNDTIIEQGSASVYGFFGSATIAGGELRVTQSQGVSHEQARSGNATLVGGVGYTELLGGSGTTSMVGGSGSDTFVGGTGHDTMVGGSALNLFAFLACDAGGQHVITNFVSGQDQLYLEGHSLSYLEKHHDIKTAGGNTYITLDGGKTTIELQGFTDLKGSDIATHKP